MNGQYVTFGNTGTYGGKQIAVDAEICRFPGAEQMTHWYDFFSRTRHWELEPYFDVGDGGRAVRSQRHRVRRVRREARPCGGRGGKAWL